MGKATGKTIIISGTEKFQSGKKKVGGEGPSQDRGHINYWYQMSVTSTDVYTK